jgi:hypothetical protein
VKEGIFDIPERDYHADKIGDVPTLNSGCAKLIVDQSPLHCWNSHPRLNPNWVADDDRKFDMGKAVHAAVLGTPAIAVIEADDYRTSAAKLARDAALARGSIPVLSEKMPAITAIRFAIKAQLKAHEAHDAITRGKPEQTMVWEEGETWCRGLLDWLPHTGHVFYDLKSTGQSANPQEWTRALYNQGADIQCAFYRRGIRKLLKIDNPIFRFIVVEVDAPYALSVIQLSPSALDLAERKVDEAISAWAKCMKEGTWPGYPPFVQHVDAPAWRQMQYEERRVAQEAASDLTILGAG